MIGGRVVDMKGKPRTVRGKPRRYFELAVSFVEHRGGEEERVVLIFDEDQTAMLGESLQLLGLARPVAPTPGTDQESMQFRFRDGDGRGQR